MEVNKKKDQPNSNNRKGKFSDRDFYVSIILTLISILVGILFAYIVDISKQGQEMTEIITDLKNDRKKLIENLNDKNRKIDTLRTYLLLIYSRSDMTSVEQWRASIIKNKTNAENELSSFNFSSVSKKKMGNENE